MSKAEPTDLSYLPFEADYNDHFQTPSVAYSDLAPVILSLATSLSRPYTVYDPYYCSGSSIPLITASLPTMSKVTVINEPRDFYADIANDSCPTSDFIVTNPPYSETHKERCFAHCLAAVTSSFITGYAVLLPSYCVGRAYYRKLVETLPDSHTECIIVPPDAYEYKHPDDVSATGVPQECHTRCHTRSHTRCVNAATHALNGRPGTRYERASCAERPAQNALFDERGGGAQFVGVPR